MDEFICVEDPQRWSGSGKRSKGIEYDRRYTGCWFPQPLTRRLSPGGRGVAPERSKADEEEESLYSRFSVRRGLPQLDPKKGRNWRRDPARLRGGSLFLMANSGKERGPARRVRTIWILILVLAVWRSRKERLTRGGWVSMRALEEERRTMERKRSRRGIGAQSGGRARRRPKRRGEEDP